MSATSFDSNDDILIDKQFLGPDSEHGRPVNRVLIFTVTGTIFKPGSRRILPANEPKLFVTFLEFNCAFVAGSPSVVGMFADKIQAVAVTVNTDWVDGEIHHLALYAAKSGEKRLYDVIALGTTITIPQKDGDMLGFYPVLLAKQVNGQNLIALHPIKKKAIPSDWLSLKVRPKVTTA